jgi:DNA polymerase IIIc chi subunit
MTLTNTTGSEDTLLTKAEQAPSVADVVEIVQRLDTELTTARERIKELEEQVEEWRGKNAELESELARRPE